MTSQEPVPPSDGATRPPVSVTAAVAGGVLDAHLAALAWLLAAAGVPILVAAASPLRPHRVALRDALEPLADPTLRRVRIDATGTGLEGLGAADATTTLLVGLDLTPEAAPALRVPFRALARGADLVAAIEADSLDDVLARLRRPDIGLTDDEMSFLGVVVVTRLVEVEGEPRMRAVATHYLRPLARDQSGHVQRTGPAVLATWEPSGDTFEDFSWGVAAELAGRVGLGPGKLDREVERRAAHLSGLVARRVVEPEEVRIALQADGALDLVDGG